MYWKSAQMNFYKKSGVGFCVARSTISGNAKASECGTSNGLTPTLFYAAKPCTNNNNRLFGSQGHKNILQYAQC